MQATTQTAPLRLTSRAAGGHGRNLAAAMPLVVDFQSNWSLVPLLLKALGVATLLSAAGIWLMSDSQIDPSLNLVKVGVSLLFVVVGLILITVRDNSDQPEACFDPVRQELRILKRDKRGQPRTVLRRRYDSIGGARLTENSALFYEHDGNVLVEVPLGSAVARSQLRDQLSGAVQLFS